MLYLQVERELREEGQRAEDEERLAKEAIEAKQKELQQIELDRVKDVIICSSDTLCSLQ